MEKLRSIPHPPVYHIKTRRIPNDRSLFKTTDDNIQPEANGVIYFSDKNSALKYFQYNIKSCLNNGPTSTLSVSTLSIRDLLTCISNNILVIDKQSESYIKYTQSNIHNEPSFKNIETCIEYLCANEGGIKNGWKKRNITRSTFKMLYFLWSKIAKGADIKKENNSDLPFTKFKKWLIDNQFPITEFEKKHMFGVQNYLQDYFDEEQLANYNKLDASLSNWIAQNDGTPLDKKRIVISRIKEYYQQQSQSNMGNNINTLKLDLSDLNLYSLPNFLTYFPELQELNILKNSIQYLNDKDFIESKNLTLKVDPHNLNNETLNDLVDGFNGFSHITSIRTERNNFKNKYVVELNKRKNAIILNKKTQDWVQDDLLFCLDLVERSQNPEIWTIYKSKLFSELKLMKKEEQWRDELNFQILLEQLVYLLKKEDSSKKSSDVKKNNVNENKLQMNTCKIQRVLETIISIKQAEILPQFVISAVNDFMKHRSLGSEDVIQFNNKQLIKSWDANIDLFNKLLLKLKQEDIESVHNL